jgi:hypothetical protein
MDLSFLQDVKLEAVSKDAPRTRTVLPTLPETADLRVFKNGKVYPSLAFAEEFKLEFEAKVNIASEGEEPVMEVVGNGLDIFSSLDWGMIKGKLPVELLFLCAVPKSDAKVDMWASTKYDENNHPKASIFAQGANTFSKTRLLDMLNEVYGVDWATVEYVDLSVVRDSPIVSETGIYLLPKIVTTGEKKGAATYIKRENLTICPLIVADTVLSTTPTLAKKLVDPIKEVEFVAEENVAVEDAITESETKGSDGDVDAKGFDFTDPESDWADKLGAKTVK